MSEIIINSDTLPEPIFRLIRTKKVTVYETDGVINLIPVIESQSDCPLRGLAADGNLSVDKFLMMTHDDKEIDRE